MQADVAPISTPKRWPRGQKFTLTQAGLEAEVAHRDVINGVRSMGRSALDTALAAWAAPLGLQSADGVLLRELAGKKRGLNELTEALEDTGIDATAVKGSIDRLVMARLAEPVPLASQQ
jgi:hypothetical protein